MSLSSATITIASTTQAGVASPDGTTIKITPGGILYDAKKPAPADTVSAPLPPFTNAGLSIAAVGSPGLVRPDGVSILVSPQGVLYADGAAVPPAPAAASVSAFTNAGLTLASSVAPGVVFIDGVSILAAADGVLTLVSKLVGPPVDAFNCIVGSNLANSYVCLDEAERLLQALPQSPGIQGWFQLTPKQKQQSLVASTLVLDALNWAGCKCDCQQNLQWPRRMMDCFCGSNCDEIPHQIQLATAYMAAFLGEQGGFISISAGGSSGGGGGVGGLAPFSEVTVGPIKVKMKEGVTFGDTLATNIGQIPPFVADLIRNYLNAFGARQGYMGRKSIARSWGSYIGSSAYTGSMYLRGGKVYPRVGGWASDMETRNLS